MANAAFCIVATQLQASQVINRLKAIGFADKDLSVLFPDKSGTRDFAHENNTKAPEGALTGVGAGGLLGGTVGLIAGMGALAIPGIGPFIAAGPLMAALSGVALGAAVGGITGALVGFGLPEIEAKLYEGKINGGNILISAHCATTDQQRMAKAIFTECGGTDIAIVGESAVPDDGIPVNHGGQAAL